jgi:hypothetical protein
MSDEVANVIIAQTRLMELDLMITIQRMKVNELDARAKTLNARSQMERYRLGQMREQFKEMEKG